MNTKPLALGLALLLLSIHPHAQLPDTTSSDTRQTILFDGGWSFHRGGAQRAEQPEFDDSAWRALDLPHDWSIEDLPDTDSPFDRDAIGQVSAGFTTGGTGWYRKTFVVPEAYRGKRVSVQFDGVYMNADVWMNGAPLGSHPYGYTSFSFDVSERLKFGGRNVLAVKVRNEGENSRWYSGSGIYRHVWLQVVEPVHVARWGTSIVTEVVGAASANVHVETRVENQGDGRAAVTLTTRILGPAGAEIGNASSEQSVDAGGTATFAQAVPVANPALWSIESPALYRAVSEVRVSGRLLDQVQTPFGIRSIRFGVNGFELNGKPLKLKGGCFHHDHGPLGARSYDRAEERRVELLKASGFNAIRCSHNPPAPAFLDAADRLGMLVIDEAFDMWRDSKNPHDYSLFFDQWWEKDVESMIARDRNHPSVIAWSIGNEIPGMDTPRVVETAKSLAALVRKADPTRPVLAAVNSLNPKKDPFFATLDVAGYNYGSGGDHGSGTIFKTDHDRVPSRIMIQTESYPLEAFQSWMDVLDHPWLLGDFVWTAFDYIGEASIGWRGYWQEQSFFPWNLAFCGDIDICGWKRPQSFYRDALWKENQLSIVVAPPTPSFEENRNRMSWSKWHWFDAVADWTWTGHENRPIRVSVYSSCEEAELLLNGKPLGRRRTDRASSFTATWDVPYQAGELKAIGYRGGKQVAVAALRTAQDVSEIALTADRDRVEADGQDLSYVTVELRDASGTRHPKADNLVAFRITGPGTIVGVANANPVSLESYQHPQRKAWQGRCLVVVKSGTVPGEIRLEASSAGLPARSITIRAVTSSSGPPAGTQTAPLPEMYRSVHALTWVVRDVTKAVEGWRKLGFDDLRSLGTMTLADVRYRGKPSTCRARVAEGHLGDVAVQWIQPIEGNNAYADFLARHGDGVFSLVHRAPTPEALQAEIERMAALGVGVLQSERVPAGRGAVIRTYLDTEPQGKYALGLVYYADGAAPAEVPPGRKVAQYAFTVRALAPVLDFWSRLGFVERSVTHPPLWDLRYHEKPAAFDAELGWQRHGRVSYEWILPLKGPTVYLDQMSKHGEGFHHIAFEVDDLDAEIARWNSLGFPFVQGGAWGEKGKPGWGRFAYHDTQALGGADVELLWNYRSPAASNDAARSLAPGAGAGVHMDLLARLTPSDIARFRTRNASVFQDPATRALTLTFKHGEGEPEVRVPVRELGWPTDWRAWRSIQYTFATTSVETVSIGFSDGKVAKAFITEPLPGIRIAGVIPFESFVQTRTMNPHLPLGFKVWLNRLFTFERVEEIAFTMRYPSQSSQLTLYNFTLREDVPADDIIDRKPLIDEYGQWIPENWPGKAHDDQGLQELWKADASIPVDHGFCPLGGDKSRTLRGTGFFRVEKLDGRWVMVDPHGHPFFSTGMDLVGYKQGSFATDVTRREYLFERLPEPGPAWLTPGKTVSFYTANIMRRFGDAWEKKWQDHTVARLRNWGFNTVANWSDYDVATTSGMPYVLPLQGWTTRKVFPFPWNFPDVFSQEFRDNVDQAARRQLTPLKDDPNLIGWFVGNEPQWARSFGSLTPWPDMLLADPEPSATKNKLEELLKANPGREEQVKDDFLYACAEEYFRVIVAALRRHDPNHLVLGIRFAENPNNRWVEMSRLFDVFSVNIYSREFRPNPDDIRRFSEVSGKPVLIGEFTACAPGRGMQGLFYWGHKVRDHAERGKAYRYYVENSAASPYIVGTHWFQMVDDLPTGRPSDEERLNYGFINVIDLPYPDLVDAARQTHRRIYDLKNGSVTPYAEKPRYN